MEEVHEYLEYYYERAAMWANEPAFIAQTCKSLAL